MTPVPLLLREKKAHERVWKKGKRGSERERERVSRSAYKVSSLRERTCFTKKRLPARDQTTFAFGAMTRWDSSSRLLFFCLILFVFFTISLPLSCNCRLIRTLMSNNVDYFSHDYKTWVWPKHDQSSIRQDEGLFGWGRTTSSSSMGHSPSIQPLFSTISDLRHNWLYLSTTKIHFMCIFSDLLVQHFRKCHFSKWIYLGNLK